ncbi:MAG: hypothetical protein JRD68_05975 [Deltaproteobacteria bacterium]|nr:hypothetical protein [Deltaproteobacteria bacterium]
MSNLNETTERLKKAGERLSRLSFEERYERVLALARQFLTAKVNVGYPFPEEEATDEDAAFLVMSWQDQKHVNSLVECLEWAITGTLRTPQPIRNVLPEESFPRQAVVF